MLNIRQQFLRGYIATVVNDLIEKRVIRKSDPITKIIEIVLSEFAKDCKEILTDLGQLSVLAVETYGHTLIANAFREIAGRFK